MRNFKDAKGKPGCPGCLNTNLTNRGATIEMRSGFEWSEETVSCTAYKCSDCGWEGIYPLKTKKDWETFGKLKGKHRFNPKTQSWWRI